ncbi:hypothetical protein BV22DRAFT_471825 [Leucogyrophana mollusca]|uniref:Uncharacterized protein n=1 Tax=Leucogyrophana mollusca TaxID=85980 RepID=A0ACB8BGH3_9AGAM|nr:hypothetical protein BV22DRAFT_471825 [Leucogyrophana mollusca]
MCWPCPSTGALSEAPARGQGDCKTGLSPGPIKEAAPRWLYIDQQLTATTRLCSMTKAQECTEHMTGGMAQCYLDRVQQQAHSYPPSWCTDLRSCPNTSCTLRHLITGHVASRSVQSERTTRSLKCDDRMTLNPSPRMSSKLHCRVSVSGRKR